MPLINHFLKKILFNILFIIITKNKIKLSFNIKFNPYLCLDFQAPRCPDCGPMPSVHVSPSHCITYTAFHRWWTILYLMIRDSLAETWCIPATREQSTSVSFTKSECSYTCTVCRLFIRQRRTDFAWWQIMDTVEHLLLHTVFVFPVNDLIKSFV